MPNEVSSELPFNWQLQNDRLFVCFIPGPVTVVPQSSKARRESQSWTHIVMEISRPHLSWPRQLNREIEGIFFIRRQWLWWSSASSSEKRRDGATGRNLLFIRLAPTKISTALIWTGLDRIITKYQRRRRFVIWHRHLDSTMEISAHRPPPPPPPHLCVFN